MARPWGVDLVSWFLRCPHRLGQAPLLLSQISACSFCWHAAWVFVGLLVKCEVKGPRSCLLFVRVCLAVGSPPRSCIGLANCLGVGLNWV